MTVLNQALAQINNWLQQKSLLPSISLQQLSNLLELKNEIQLLPFCLPYEVNEIYRWHKIFSQASVRIPVDFLFYTYFCDFDESIRLMQEFLEFEEDDDFPFQYMGKPLFPICEREGEYLAVICDEEENEFSPVVHLSKIGEINVVYTSLTNMILTTSEIYLSEHLITPDKIQKQYSFKSEKSLIIQAYRKYNSNLLDVVLDIFQNTKASYNMLSNLQNQLIWMLENWGDISVANLKNSKIIALLTEALQSPQKEIQDMAVLLLEKLKIVEPLIQALDSENQQICGKAIWALGEIGDLRVVQHLSKLLDNPDTGIQEASQQALEKIRHKY